jgi:nucleoside phosphorylase
LHFCCVDCCPGSRRGDTEQVVARWRRSVASGEALVMLHWAMRSVLHRRTTMAIEMARNGVTFVCHRRLF